jgi:purine-nucleoside phosphorylase
MPRRLRPTASYAADAILVGDPGRALLLAQELLVEPKMSNHARGLWGYSGQTSAGRPLTIQSTGMGGPSAALVLSDLNELGVQRVVRIGTGTGLRPGPRLAELVVVEEAVAAGGSAGSLGVGAGESVAPDATLTRRLAEELGQARSTRVSSFDAHPGGETETARAEVGDMQTTSLLAAAAALGIAAAALLIVTETASGTLLAVDDLAQAEKRAGQAAAAVLSA